MNANDEDYGSSKDGKSESNSNGLLESNSQYDIVYDDNKIYEESSDESEENTGKHQEECSDNESEEDLELDSNNIQEDLVQAQEWLNKVNPRNNNRDIGKEMNKIIKTNANNAKNSKKRNSSQVKASNGGNNIGTDKNNTKKRKEKT